MQTILKKTKKTVLKKAAKKNNSERISKYPKGSYEAIMAAAEFARQRNLENYAR